MEINKGNTVKSLYRLSLQRWVIYIYFFFNSVFLKGGLLYTNILSPWFLVWITRKGYLKAFIYATLVLLPFSVFHATQGAELKSLLISNLLFLSTIISVIAAWIYINHYESLKSTLQALLIVNFGFTLLAIPFYFMNERFQKIFWYTNLFTTQKTFTRLSLMTFEASYYALLLIPLVYYFVFRLSFENKDQHKKLILFMALLPFLLTLSFGVIGTSIIISMFMLWNVRKNFKTSQKLVNIVGFSILTLVVVCLAGLLFFQNSLIVQRVFNIFTGYDTSGRGRTFESFMIAWKIVQKTNIWLGCGLGQSKHLLPDIIHQYFSHWGNLQLYRIPNAMAETLAAFGICGVIMKLLAQVYLFNKTGVNKNYFRLSLFLFVFIYQFTGSYLTNLVEFVIWIFAFSDKFKEFDVKNIMNPEHA